MERVRFRVLSEDEREAVWPAVSWFPIQWTIPFVMSLFAVSTFWIFGLHWTHLLMVAFAVVDVRWQVRAQRAALEVIERAASMSVDHLGTIGVVIEVDDATVSVVRVAEAGDTTHHRWTRADVTGLGRDGDEGDRLVEFLLWGRAGEPFFLGIVAGVEEAKRVAAELEAALGVPWLTPWGTPWHEADVVPKRWGWERVE